MFLVEKNEENSQCHSCDKHLAAAVCCLSFCFLFLVFPFFVCVSVCLCVCVSPVCLCECVYLPDSRAVLSRNFTAEALSFDHKPEREDERRRIEALGAVIAHTPEEAEFLAQSKCYQSCFLLCGGEDPKSEASGPPRIFPGGIAVSRSLGDVSMKVPGYVSAQAEFTQYQIGGQDQFMVLACDGLWDVFSNQEVVDIVLAVWVRVCTCVPSHTSRASPILIILDFCCCCCCCCCCCVCCELMNHVWILFFFFFSFFLSFFLSFLLAFFLSGVGTPCSVDAQHLGAQECVKQLVKAAYSAGSADNISAIVVFFQKPIADAAAVAARGQALQHREQAPGLRRKSTIMVK